MDSRLAYLEYLRQKFYGDEQVEANKGALLEAVEHCAMFRLVMPDWVVYEFAKSYGKWNKLEVETLDKAFGVEREARTRIQTEHDYMNYGTSVYMAMLEYKKKGVPMRKAKHLVAKELAMNHRKVWEMYQNIRNLDLIAIGFEKITTKRK